MSALFVIRQQHFCHCQKLQRCARRVFLDEGLDFSHLRGTVTAFLQQFFGDLPVRFRASYFPFTEPSVEVDVGYSTEGGRRVVGGHGDAPGHAWMEIGGSGMVNARVLEFAGDLDQFSLAARMSLCSTPTEMRAIGVFFPPSAEILAYAMERKQRPFTPVYADADAQMALNWLQAAGADRLVHGHTHRPATHPLPSGMTRWVLSDWDLDAPPTALRAEVLRLSAAGLQRVKPASR